MKSIVVTKRKQANSDGAVAYMEMRTLTAQLILNFDVALAPGEDGHRLLYKTRDHFTLGLGEIDLVFTPVAS